MSHRARRPQRSTSLRAAAVATAVACGVLAAPSATAFASDTTPKPKPTTSAPSPEGVSPEDVKKKRAAAEEALKEGRPTKAPRGGVAAGDKPVVREDDAKPTPKPLSPDARKKLAAEKAARTPEGGVAAGERPASGGDGNTGTLVGSAAGIALLAGASTVVLRRRAAGGRQG